MFDPAYLVHQLLKPLVAYRYMPTAIRRPIHLGRGLYTCLALECSPYGETVAYFAGLPAVVLRRPDGWTPLARRLTPRDYWLTGGKIPPPNQNLLGIARRLAQCESEDRDPSLAAHLVFLEVMGTFIPDMAESARQLRALGWPLLVEPDAPAWTLEPGTYDTQE